MGIPIARIFGIEIRVQLGWVIVLALIAVIAVGQLTAADPQLEAAASWILGGLVALGFFVSSVSHDLAHALVARRRGVEVQTITIAFFGGSTPFDPASPNPGDDAAIALSGPLTSMGLAALFFGVGAAVVMISGEFNAAAVALSLLVLLNLLLLGLVHLVPAYPLDGGRIVRDLAWRRSGSERVGWRAAAMTGRATGLVVIAIGIYMLFSTGDVTGAMVALTGWFLILSANAVRERVRLDDLVGGHLVREAMEPEPVTVHPALTVDTFASQLLGASPVTAVPVVQGDEVVGLLGIGQVRRLLPARWASTRVEDVMAKPPRLVFLGPGDPLKGALERIQRAGLDGLPVTENGILVGVLTRRGIATFVQARQAPPTSASTPAAAPTPDSAAEDGEGPPA
jgi:Zn-dependent protease/CBS domain-containing protein